LVPHILSPVARRRDPTCCRPGPHHYRPNPWHLPQLQKH
jgi:hypothetical protein